MCAELGKQALNAGPAWYVGWAAPISCCPRLRGRLSTRQRSEHAPESLQAQTPMISTHPQQKIQASLGTSMFPLGSHRPSLPPTGSTTSAVDQKCNPPTGLQQRSKPDCYACVRSTRRAAQALDVAPSGTWGGRRSSAAALTCRAST